MIGDANHPKLYALVVLGILGLLVAAVIAIIPAFGSSRTIWGVRLGFVAFLLFIAGAAGYVAIATFERQEHP